jgi:hypothetical protein
MHISVVVLKKYPELFCDWHDFRLQQDNTFILEIENGFARMSNPTGHPPPFARLTHKPFL